MNLSLLIIANLCRSEWYSCESFFLVKVILDHIPAVTTVLIITALVSSGMYHMDGVYWALTLVMVLYGSSALSMGLVLATCCEKSLAPAFISLIIYLMIYNPAFVPYYDFDPTVQKLGVFSAPAYGIGYMLAWVYGDRCHQDQVSSLLYKYKIDPDDGVQRNFIVLLLITILFRMFCYFAIKVRVNYDLIAIKFNHLADRFRR